VKPSSAARDTIATSAIAALADRDVRPGQAFTGPVRLNLEMAATDEMVAIARLRGFSTNPHRPQGRAEVPPGRPQCRRRLAR
jgi:hypothetical protein